MASDYPFIKTDLSVSVRYILLPVHLTLLGGIMCPLSASDYPFIKTDLSVSVRYIQLPVHLTVGELSVPFPAASDYPWYLQTFLSSHYIKEF